MSPHSGGVELWYNMFTRLTLIFFVLQNKNTSTLIRAHYSLKLFLKNVLTPVSANVNILVLLKKMKLKIR